MSTKDRYYPKSFVTKVGPCDTLEKASNDSRIRSDSPHTLHKNPELDNDVFLFCFLKSNQSSFLVQQCATWQDSHVQHHSLLSQTKESHSVLLWNSVYKNYEDCYLSLCNNSFLGEFLHSGDIKYFSVHEVNFQDFALQVIPKMDPQILKDAKNHAKKQLFRAMCIAICSRADVSWSGTSLKSREEQEQKNEELRFRQGSLELYSFDLQPTDFELPEPLYSDPPLVTIANQSTTQGVEEMAKLFPNHVKAQHDQFQTFSSQKTQPTSSQEEVDSTKQDQPTNTNNNSEEDDIDKKKQQKSRENQPTKIGWLNMANAHNVGGTYGVPFKGSQEEETATVCEAIVHLGQVGVYLQGHWYNLRKLAWKKPHLVYKYGFHHPPGGGYASSTRFVNNRCSAEQPIAEMISVAFADFRPAMMGQETFLDQVVGERDDFFTSSGEILDLTKYIARIEKDIEAAIKLAILRGVDVFVAGASGCGAFLHDPYIEAQSWRKLLRKYQFYFKHVRFSILAVHEKDEQNLVAFQKVFEENL